MLQNDTAANPFVAYRDRRKLIPPKQDGTAPEVVQFDDNWPGVSFTEVGLVFAEHVDYQTWIKVGRFLGYLNSRSRLWIADWLEEGDRRGYGHTYDDLREITGLEKETLMNYASIGRRVPIVNRIVGPRTSWYAAVASLDTYRQVPILKRAATEGWDRDMLRAAVKQEKCGNTSENVPPFPFEEESESMASLTPALGLCTDADISEARSLAHRLNKALQVLNDPDPAYKSDAVRDRYFSAKKSIEIMRAEALSLADNSQQEAGDGQEKTPS